MIDAGGACGDFRQLPSAARVSLDRSRRPRWRVFPALALAALLACWGPVAEAAYDPRVEAVQQALSDRGFDPGTIDGLMGSRTRQALRAFQTSTGLPPTGAIDTATLTALGLESPNAASTPAPAAPPPGSVAGSDAGSDAAPASPSTSLLRFATLGWHPPGTGAEALERFRASGAPPDLARGTGSLFVPEAGFVFLLHAGERVPGLDCDPSAGRITVEFVFGANGPIIFTPAAGGELCRMGLGIALAVGRTLEMRAVDWGGVRYARGTVRVTGTGLRYID